MKITEDMLMEILRQELPELWKTAKIIQLERPDDEELNSMMKQAENGFLIKESIYWLIEPGFVEIDRKNLHMIIVNGPYYHLLDYWADKEKRETILRKIILEHADELDFIVGEDEIEPQEMYVK